MQRHVSENSTASAESSTAPPARKERSMAQISWGKVGDRFFEAGVDRGVLYAPGHDGVPWNGLVSVKENVVGGEAQPFYIDGFKYINLSASEEFAATIDAFAAPAEFGACDGTVSISNGLFITQQPRVPFGFSFRTKVGNDGDGTDHGYKIHLVYDALAAPSSRENKTLSQSTDLNTLSWEITTAPPLLVGYRPTAHFVIDTRDILPDNWRLLGTIESMLYGDSEGNAYLPSQSDLVTLFSTWEG